MGYGFRLSLDVPAIISLILAVVCYLFFVCNDNSYSGFLGWIHDVLSFKKLMVSGLLKFFYIFAALVIIIYGFIMMFKVDFKVGLGILILGSALVRIVYEFLMMNIVICRNTSEISNRMTKSGLSSKKQSAAAEGQDLSNRPTRRTAPAPEQAPSADVCPSCGSPMKPTAKFCPVCGAKR